MKVRTMVVEGWAMMEGSIGRGRQEAQPAPQSAYTSPSQPARPTRVVPLGEPERSLLSIIYPVNSRYLRLL